MPNEETANDSPIVRSLNFHGKSASHLQNQNKWQDPRTDVTWELDTCANFQIHTKPTELLLNKAQ